MKNAISVLLLLMFAGNLFATHNRSGEITYRQTGPLTIETTITTYTKASSAGADRDSLELFWGDGTSTVIGRSNGEGELIPGLDIQVNFYVDSHTYPGRATYKMYFQDPNRVNEIQNLNFPNSVDIKFYIETTFTLFDDQFNGLNNSAILLQPPIDFACTNKRFIHNPNAFDPDGDSLAYELVIPLQALDSIVPNYQFPDQIMPGPNNIVSFDNRTGDFVWNAPQRAGEYNIAIKIKEYREGTLINSIIRDMQILVRVCENDPPVIETVEEYCVVAGEQLEIPIEVSDLNENDLIQVTATGGIFQIADVDIDWDNSGIFRPSVIRDTLRWNTECIHIREEPYQLVFRAQDNNINANTGLTDLKTIRVYVMGPPPLDVQAEASETAIEVSWEAPYVCDIDADDYFRGFSVWKKIGSNPFEIDSCVAGLDGQGYTQIAFLVQNQVGNRFVFQDTDFEAGKVYCYRVLANFSLKTNAQTPQFYNFSRSISSEEVCVTARRNVPLLTAVDVKTTSTNNGEIFVSWVKPLAADVDTLTNMGPYNYQLQRSIDNINYSDVPGAAFSSVSFAEAIDTSFLDTGLNTVANSYHYRVNFSSNGFSIGDSPPSESVFLSIVSSDQRNLLSWEAETSWQNYEYDVFRFDDTLGDFDFITRTSDTEYLDNNLENEVEYCYKVRSLGTYGLPNTPEDIFNFSQELCGTPIDTVGPCAPTLNLANDCEELQMLPQIWELINFLSWNNPSFVCEESNDVAGYNLFYSPLENGDYELIYSTSDVSNISFDHIPSEGSSACYFVTAFDINGNESEPSNLACIDNCPQYELPNTFTPNGDGANDEFLPRRNRFIDQVEFELFNEWGVKVFETTDPELNWDGTDLKGRDVQEGVYYYTCALLDELEEGVLTQRSLLSGYIQVLR